MMPNNDFTHSMSKGGQNLGEPGSRPPAPGPQPATDIIGGFQVASYDCLGCGEPLQMANAWMADGCPCNSKLGVNSMNEHRWRLLMALQQHQSAELALTKSELARTQDELADLERAVTCPYCGFSAPDTSPDFSFTPIVIGHTHLNISHCNKCSKNWIYSDSLNYLRSGSL
jgi:DNA-directed RNA polymerase subunit RPC12/RpoP